MRKENVARKISQLSQLFLPQQYSFSQFASFSSCNLFFFPKSPGLLIFWYFLHFAYFLIILAKLLKFHPICFSSSFIKYLEKFHSPSPCLLSIWVNSKLPVYFLPPPHPRQFKVFLGNFGEQTTKAKILCSFCFHSKLFITTFIACNCFWKMNPRNILCSQLFWKWFLATFNVRNFLYYRFWKLTLSF